MQTQKILIRDLEFTIDTAGIATQPLVILLHGFPHSSYSWRHQLPELEKNGYFAIAPNQRGYSPGARPKGVSNYELATLVEDVLHMAQSFGHERFHVVGHDWGGQVAWAVAAAAPDRVISLTTVSRPHPAAFRDALRDDPEQRVRSVHHRRFQDADMAKRLLSNGSARLKGLLRYESVACLFDDGELERASSGGVRRMSEADVETYVSALSSTEALEAALNWYRASFSGDSALAAANIGEVSVPAMMLWGTNDVSVGRMAAERTAKYVSAMFELVEISGAGHFLCDQVPGDVTLHLLRHLDNNSVGRTVRS